MLFLHKIDIDKKVYKTCMYIWEREKQDKCTAEGLKDIHDVYMCGWAIWLMSMTDSTITFICVLSFA